jgi:hypothetical protein
MLIPLLLLTADNSQQYTIEAAARAHSWRMIHRLNTHRHELQPLLHSMTHTAYSIPALQLDRWTRRLELMPEQFWFTNNAVVYREFVSGGVLMLAECMLVQPVVLAMGRVENMRSVLNIFFYACANAEAGTYEVRVIPPNGVEPATAVAKFGQDFFQMLSGVDLNAPIAGAVEVEKKKGWRRRMF